MALAGSYRDLLRYKVRDIGLRNTLFVAYLDLLESFLYRMARRFPSISVSPRSMQIECTTKCNLKCSFCELTYWTEKPSDLTFDSIQQMLAHLPKLKRVDLTGIGESLMNRQFFQIVELLKAKGMYVTLNDNFTLVTESTARRIVDLGVDQIFLSLDGATKKTFESIRYGANFDKVLANTRRLIQIKREAGKKIPEVKINTVVCLANYQEMPSVVELAHDLGIGMVQFVNVITFEETAVQDTAAVRRDVSEKLDQTRQVARQRGVLIKVELFDKLPVQQCDFPWKRNFVTYDGYVHPCCYTTQTGDRQAQNARSLGNVLTHSFHEIWTGEPYSALRMKMRQGILPAACERCPKYVGRPDGRHHRRVSGDIPVLPREGQACGTSQ